MSWSTVLGYASGVWLLVPQLSEESLLPTVLLIHTLDAVLSRLFARNNGYRENLWTAIGFVGGLWVVLYLLAHTQRRQRGGVSRLSSTFGDDPGQGPGSGVG